MLRATLRDNFRLLALIITVLWVCVTAQAQSVERCTHIEISCPASFVGSSSKLIFAAKLNAVDASARLTYNWNVAAGTILSGQGTPTITVDMTGIERIGTTVTVEVSGLPQACPKTASCVFGGVIGCGRPLDEYGNIRFEDAMARLDNLAVELMNDPSASAHFICYGGRVGRAGEAQRHCDRAKNDLITRRGIEATRIIAEDGGYRENLTVAFWVVPEGAIPPSPSPTVDPSEVKFIRSKSRRKTRRR